MILLRSSSLRAASLPPGRIATYTILNKGDDLNIGNCSGLKLNEQVKSVLEHVVEKLIRQRVGKDEMQFSFMPGCGTILIQNSFHARYRSTCFQTSDSILPLWT